MCRHGLSVVLLGLIIAALPARGSDPAPFHIHAPAAEQTPGSGGTLLPSSALCLESAIQANEESHGNAGAKKGKNNKEGNNGEPKPEKDSGHIRDNAFLVEEAFNQEPGDVQHIFNWINFWNRTLQSRTRDFAFTYTMELPLGSQKHQFSFTTQFLTAFEKPHGGQAH